MQTDLGALLNLQKIERQLAQVRTRLRRRENAVNVQQKRIDDLQQELDALHTRIMEGRKTADSLDVDLKAREEQITKLRAALNGAKSNKEYASLLTQINTYKADNAKFEEEALRIMQEAETLQAQVEEIQSRIEEEGKKLDEVKGNSAEEIEKLTGMRDKLQAKRDEATAGMDQATLTTFERIADRYEGEAMAPVEVIGKKPPHDYVCGGCYMAITAEHANALRMRDEIRRCDNCGRILYMDEDPARAG
ncbi:MAG: zinc ribbon domain-containing protein [Phycisphaerae bacterium]